LRQAETAWLRPFFQPDDMLWACKVVPRNSNNPIFILTIVLRAFRAAASSALKISNSFVDKCFQTVREAVFICLYSILFKCA
ncbi:MAG TPA: hypothetical protein VGP47_07420, partial [Parachlamydiaceae bacterium]|nr:hypothetical protein [Parachlamydiaceae bacterium]